MVQVVDQVAQAQADGYHAYFEGYSLYECEYDREAEAELFAAWHEGWDEASMEEVDTDFDED